MDVNEANKKSVDLPLLRPAFVAFSAALGAMACGTIFGYPFVAIPDLLSAINKPPFPINNPAQFGTWFSTLPFIGAIPGGLLGSWSKDKFGRKCNIILGSVLSIVAWTLIINAINVAMLYVGATLNGFSAILLLSSAIVYIAEISPTKYRGMLMALVELGISLGTLIIYVTGMFLRWNNVALVPVCLSAVCAVLMCLMPETPLWLMYKSRNDAALKSVRWLYGGISAEICADMLAAFEESLTAMRQPTPWLNLLRQPLIKPLVITQILFFLQVFCGFYCIRLDLIEILQTAGSSLGETAETLIYSAVSLAGSFVCLFVIDRGSRRMFLMLSTATMALSTAALAIYFQVNDRSKLSWLPLTALIASTFGYGLGLGPVPPMILVELFHTRARARATVIAVANYCLSLVLNIQMIGQLDAVIGKVGTFWLSSAFSILGFIFIYFFVPNTRGLVLE